MNNAAYAETRWAKLQNRDDPVWDLDTITNRSETIVLLKRFENRLCIYSAYVERFYGSYGLVVPESDHGGITVLPSERAWHDTFHDIPLAAVKPTGIRILSGRTVGYHGFCLKISGEHRLVTSRGLLFQGGLRPLIQRYQVHDNVFLPILVKGGLHEYGARMPLLRLHQINPVRLSTYSLLSLNAVKGAIADHLIGLFRQQ